MSGPMGPGAALQPRARSMAARMMLDSGGWINGLVD